MKKRLRYIQENLFNSQNTLQFYPGLKDFHKILNDFKQKPDCNEVQIVERVDN